MMGRLEAIELDASIDSCNYLPAVPSTDSKHTVFLHISAAGGQDKPRHLRRVPGLGQVRNTGHGGLSAQPKERPRP